MNELRRDPITARWIVVPLDKLADISDLVTAQNPKNKESCPFCYGSETMTPPEIMAHRKYGGPNSPNWTVRVVPNKFPALRIEGELERQGFCEICSRVISSEISLFFANIATSISSLPMSMSRPPVRSFTRSAAIHPTWARTVISNFRQIRSPQAPVLTNTRSRLLQRLSEQAKIQNRWPQTRPRQ